MSRKRIVNNYQNLAVVWKPHYQTNKCRVAMRNQRSEKTNYVIICCDESLNGLYKWDATKKEEYTKILNKKTLCCCVPMEDLKFIKKLNEMDERYQTLIKSEIKKYKRHEKKKLNYGGSF